MQVFAKDPPRSPEQAHQSPPPPAARLPVPAQPAGGARSTSPGAGHQPGPPSSFLVDVRYRTADHAPYGGAATARQSYGSPRRAGRSPSPSPGRLRGSYKAAAAAAVMAVAAAGTGGFEDSEEGLRLTARVELTEGGMGARGVGEAAGGRVSFGGGPAWDGRGVQGSEHEEEGDEEGSDDWGAARAHGSPAAELEQQLGRLVEQVGTAWRRCTCSLSSGCHITQGHTLRTLTR